MYSMVLELALQAPNINTMSLVQDDYDLVCNIILLFPTLHGQNLRKTGQPFYGCCGKVQKSFSGFLKAVTAEKYLT